MIYLASLINGWPCNAVAVVLCLCGTLVAVVLCLGGTLVAVVLRYCGTVVMWY